jgi:hypothetical protein
MASATSRHDRLGPLIDVNALGLHWLLECSRHPASDGNAFIKAHKKSLSTLTEARLLNLASRLPLLLFDLHFQDDTWWTRQAQWHAHSLHGLPPVQSEPGSPVLTGLARSALVLAWHTARTDRDAARVMLGLSPAVANVFTQLHLQNIDALATRHHAELTPRWPRNTALWKSILSAGKGKDALPDNLLALQCLSLAAGELLRAS